VLVRAAPSLETFSVLMPEDNGRPMANILEDWITFGEEMVGVRENNRGGLAPVRPGLDGITTLCLQNWDLIPTAPMSNLKTVKLAVRDNWATIPQVGGMVLTNTHGMPQVTTVHLAYHPPAPMPDEVQRFHRYLNRFPSATTLYLDFSPDRFWVVPQVDSTRTLFNEQDCLVNQNVKNLHINQLKLYKLNEDPNFLAPLEFLISRFPEVVNFSFGVGTLPVRITGFIPEHDLDAIFNVIQRFPKIRALALSKNRIWSSELRNAMTRLGFCQRLESLILHQEPSPRALTKELDVEKEMMLAAVLLGSRIPHFQLSGFESQLDNDHIRAILLQEQEKLQNISFENYELNEMFTNGMNLCKQLPQIKL